ncbi:MAG: ABC transporter substrate-binding protein/permease [bacterium]
MIKRIILIFTCLFVAVGLTACADHTDRSHLFDYTTMEVDKLNFDDYENLSQTELDTLLINPGKLSVGTSPDFAPSSFLDLDLTGLSRVQGTESAVSLYVAKSLGLELEFVTSTFDGMTIDLSNGKSDVVFSGLSQTALRAQSYDFTSVYQDAAPGSQVLMTLKSNLEKYTSVDDINKSTITIGFQEGSLQESLVKDQLSDAKTKYVKNENAILELQNGGVEFMAYSQGAAEVIVNNNQDIVIVEVFQFSVVGIGTCGLVKKGNTLTKYLSEAIETIPEGQYTEWKTSFVEYANEISFNPSNVFIVRVFQIVGRYGSYFLEGAGITVALSILTVIFGTILGVGLLALKKNNIKPLRVIGTTYIEVVRGVPLLLQLWVIYIIVPNSWSPFLSVCVALILNSGAYVSEIIRAGIEGIDKGQYEACRSLGLSKIQAMKKVVLPQAIKKISPALGNEFVMLIKETSLASVFFVGDLMTIKNTITSLTYLTLEPFIVIAIVYFVLTFSATKGIKYLESKMEA